MTKLALYVLALVVCLTGVSAAQTPFRFTGEAAIITNADTGEVLWESHSDDVRSIASISKLMTATVLLDSGANLDQVITVTRADVFRSNRTFIRPGERIILRDVLNIALVASDNAAARVLARSSSYGATKNFIIAMNVKAVELGLTATTYVDPAGLMAGNKSSAADMATFLSWLGTTTAIPEITQQVSYRTVTKNKRPRTIRVGTTNRLVRDHDYDVITGKTGFTHAAGYCFAVLAQLGELEQNVAVVVLGSTSNTNRFGDARRILEWAAASLGIGTPVVSP